MKGCGNIKFAPLVRRGRGGERKGGNEGRLGHGGVMGKSW